MVLTEGLNCGIVLNVAGAETCQTLIPAARSAKVVVLEDHPIGYNGALCPAIGNMVPSGNRLEESLTELLARLPETSVSPPQLIPWYTRAGGYQWQ